MSGLLRRIRRPGVAEETRTEATPLPEPAHGSAPETAPVRADGSPLPAGVTAEDLERRGGVGRRRKIRRRVRFLRRARELALRDLGGLVYEAHRRDRDGERLVKEKVAHLGVIDTELQALEPELGAPRSETVLREPGVGGTCPRCGELHASDAHFCSRCGLDLTAVPAELGAAAKAAEPGASEAAASRDAAAAKPAEPAAGESTAQTAAAETTPAQPPRESKRWWRRSSATPAEPATSEPAAAEAAEPATDADPATNAEPATTAAPAGEQPTTDLATDSSQTGNGRATKQDVPDRERSV